MNGEDTRDYRFATGVAIGSVVGAGLAMWFAPRAAAEIRERAIGAAKDFGHTVSDRYQQARHRVVDATRGITRKGQELRDGLYDTVAQAAHGVEVGAQHVQQAAAGAKSHKPS
jgi:gas vesicle protein